MTDKIEKQRRMQIRRDIGSRVVESPEKGTYTKKHRYLIAHACFECCKSFKIEPKEQGQEPAKCPECCNEIILMGRAFKPPKKTDIKQWKKVKYLVDNGILFHRYNDERYGPYPKTLEEAYDFVEHVKQLRKDT